MEKINTEILVSSLFAVGFDKVDALLFTCILGQLSIDNQQLKLFEFEDEETHQLFNKYVDYDGVIFKLKDGVTLDTMASYNNEKFYQLRKLLNTNRRLIEYLSELDFRKIIQRKIRMIGLERLQQYEEFFSYKEKEILYEMFGVSSLSDIFGSIKSVARPTISPLDLDSYSESEKTANEKNVQLGRRKRQ